jgi:hypothetical protein
MTTHEAFKKRVRARMAKTGERYGAARRALIAASAQPNPSGWAANPQHTDEQVREKTGRGWNDWVTAIDAGPGRASGHTAIAAWLVDQGVEAWWAQGVTVGFERITGLRMPGQMPDGTFTISRSRVIAMPPVEVRTLLLDDAARADLLPDFEVTLLSRPDAKTPRYAFARRGEVLGQVSFATDVASAARTRLTVTHAKLPAYDEGELWKEFWSEWLDALGGE